MLLDEKYENDRFFKIIFGNKKHKSWALSLYNALNGSAYSAPENLHFIPVENALYLGMDNDVAFIIADTINLFRPDLSYTPNIPMKFLIHAGEVYTVFSVLRGAYAYRRTQQKAPSPRFICFHNCEEEGEDRSILRLESAFDTYSDLSLRVTMINALEDTKLSDRCQPFREYSWFLSNFMKQSDDDPIDAAIDAVLKRMPDDFMLKSFLQSKSDEIKDIIREELNEGKFRPFPIVSYWSR